jgi:hypothetical protein
MWIDRVQDHEWNLAELRALALRAPVFLGSLTRKTRRSDPPPPPSLFIIGPPGETNDIQRIFAEKSQFGKNPRTQKAALYMDRKIYSTSLFLW